MSLTAVPRDTASVPLEKVIQFLVSPQRDFIGRIKTEDGQPPNALHVGPEAVRKLRGDRAKGEPDPFIETTLAFFDSNNPGSERVSIILDEDWHNSSDPEFQIYQPHCIKGSDGARLVGRLDDYRWEDNVYTIRANSINVSTHPHYRHILDTVCGTTRIERIRVGIYGVWTNIKVEYLALNLHTIAPFFPTSSIGICEPLTAVPDRHQHDAAIEKLALMKFQVFYDIPSYLKWMGMEMRT